ncbi:hypothetical protein [Undibacterium sp. RuRC25W]|uniref:hypothetical protein n=1 Tax=Undibacterium sp. RuRC25W TaxID=3413047 RepID=UPI003BF1373B
MLKKSEIIEKFLHLRITKFFKNVVDFVSEQWKSVLFSASLAAIFEHFDILTIFSKFSWLLVAGMAAQNSSIDVTIDSHTPIVVTLSEERFVSHYSEKSPLDRCVLRQDIAAILAKGTQRLAIDFDLSPLAKANASDFACQESLDALLDQESKRLVILTPLAVNGALKNIKHTWMLQRCTNGVHFGDGVLDKSLGLVNERFVGEEEILQTRFAEQLHEGFNDYACKLVKEAPTAAENPWLQKEDEKKESTKYETSPINFSAVQSHLAVIDIGSQDFSDSTQWEQNPVLFGFDADKEDKYLTPLGKLAGVIIHGAQLISLEYPIDKLTPSIGLLVDMGIAFCFAWVVGQFWSGYVMATRFDIHIHEISKGHLRTAIGTGVIIAFILVYLLLVLYFIFAAEFIFLKFHFMLAPLLMAISILFDGFVSAPIEQIQRLLEEHKEKKEGAEKAEIIRETDKEKHRLGMRFKRSGIVIVSLSTLLTGAIYSEWLDFASIAGATFGFLIVGLYVSFIFGCFVIAIEKWHHRKKLTLLEKRDFSWIHVRHWLEKLLPFKIIPNATPEQQYKQYMSWAVRLGYVFGWLRGLSFWLIILLGMNFIFLGNLFHF